ncbi:MAG TPA: hypothetical protein VFY86_10115 [Nocardioides sp.]|nr:hypothetical protein [Nocardioides sp.]
MSPESERTLVIVTGSGRSGTSTVTGSLKMLGCYVPQPEIPANEANPRGYFEPKWTVEFQKRVLADAGVRTLDARPEAYDLMQPTCAKAEFRDELREWFATQLKAPQIVVKDPRSFWLRNLWVPVASDLGVETRFLTMLRHPAEVVGSRDMHYLKNADESRRLARETGNLGGWINVALTNEYVGRESPRAFVHYTDMISDWRKAMLDAGEKLGLTYDADLTSDAHHPIDDFIDSSLRRSQLDYDDLDVPDQLVEIAKTVWENLDALSKDPYDEAAMKSNDELREAYGQLHTWSVALTQDHTNYSVDVARAQTRRKVTRELGAQAAQPAQPAASLPRRVVRKVRSLARQARPSRTGA